jgi:Skp family chaperone for outer membrane proteins
MKLEIEKFGWIAAAGVAAIIFASGFDTPTLKFGVVDVSKAMTTSDAYKRNGDDLQAQFKLRQDVLEFLNTYPVMTVAQANRFRELSLKPAPTQADTTEVNKIKFDVKDTDAKLRAAQQKANPTAADRQFLEDIGRRAPEVAGLITKWKQEFIEELNAVQDKAQAASQESAHNSVEEIGKNQAFTLIFIKDFAPYGQNDVTPDVLKAMNKK